MPSLAPIMSRNWGWRSSAMNSAKAGPKSQCFQRKTARLRNSRVVCLDQLQRLPADEIGDGDERKRIYMDRCLFQGRQIQHTSSALCGFRRLLLGRR